MRGKHGFGNARAVQNLFQQVQSRQSARILRENGKNPDMFLFEREDLLMK
jgi:hypothetical protein